MSGLKSIKLEPRVLTAIIAANSVQAAPPGLATAATTAPITTADPNGAASAR